MGKCGKSGCEDDEFKLGQCLKHYNESGDKKSGKKKRGKAKFSKNKDTITQLLGSMKSQKKFVKMISYSAECLTKMIVDDVSAEELIECGTIEVLMDVLKNNPHNEEVQKIINRVMGSICRNPEIAKQMGERMGGDFTPFINSLNTAKDEETQLSTLDTLNGLAQGGQWSLAQMQAQGLLPAMTGVITRHAGNQDIMTASATLMTHFASERDSAKKMLADGSVDSVMKCMEAHPENIELARAGFALIARLANADVEVAELLKRRGAVDLIINNLDYHPYDEDLLNDAATALKALTGEDDMSLALHILSGDYEGDLAHAAAMAKVASLALVDENVAHLFKHGGIETILAVLKGSLEADDTEVNRKIATQACRALARAAAAGNQKNVYSIIKGGGVKTLVSAVMTHPDDVELSEASLSALANMITRPENAIFISKSGGLDAALAAVRLHPHNEPIVRAALDIFTGFAQWPDTTDELIAKGGIEAIVEILKNHAHNPAITLACINALGSLASSQSNVDQMVHAGLLPLLVSAMGDHAENSMILTSSMMAMETFALVPDNADALRGFGAVGEIQDALDRYPDDMELQEVGQRALAMMNGHALAMKMAEEEAERQQLEEAQRLAEEERLAKRALEEARRLQEAEAERQLLEAEMLEQLQRMKLQEEQEMIDALEAMRAADEEEARSEAKRKRRAKREAAKKAETERLEMERRKLDQAKRDAEEAERLHLLNLMGENVSLSKVQEPERVTLKKNARAIFDSDNDDDEERELIELDPDVVAFLQAGALLTKHSKKADPRNRHVYLSVDCKWLCWKDPRHDLKPSQQMTVYSIFGVTPGRCTMQLERKKLGRYLAKEDCAFSISGAAKKDDKKSRHRHNTGERTVDLETKTRADRVRWIASLEHLIEWAKQEALYGSKTVQMKANKLHDLDSDSDDSEDDY